MALDVTFAVKPLYVASRRKKSNHFGLPRPPSRIFTLPNSYLCREASYRTDVALTDMNVEEGPRGKTQFV